MPRNKFIDDEVYCSDDDRSQSGEQYTDSYEENDDFINDSMTVGEENELRVVRVNNDDYFDERAGNDDGAMGNMIDSDLSEEDVTMEEDCTPFVLLEKHEIEEYRLLRSAEEELNDEDDREYSIYLNRERLRHAFHDHDDENNACVAVGTFCHGVGSNDVIYNHENRGDEQCLDTVEVANNNNNNDEDYDYSHRVVLNNDFDVNSACDDEEHHWKDMVGYYDLDEDAVNNEEEAERVRNEATEKNNDYLESLYNTRVDVVGVDRVNVESFHQPVSNEAMNERSMHMYLANGTFSDKSFFVETFKDILISKKSNSHKIRIPFEECVYCKGLYVKSISKMTNGIRLYKVASQKHKCCDNGKRLLQEEDVLDISKFDGDERIKEFYTHPKLHVFANRLNTEFCLHAPVFAQDGARGYTKFEYGLHGLRFEKDYNEVNKAGVVHFANKRREGSTSCKQSST
jgi:hypothetical protein